MHLSCNVAYTGTRARTLASNTRTCTYTVSCALALYFFVTLVSHHVYAQISWGSTPLPPPILPMNLKGALTLLDLNPEVFCLLLFFVFLWFVFFFGFYSCCCAVFFLFAKNASKNITFIVESVVVVFLFHSVFCCCFFFALFLLLCCILLETTT